MHTTHMIEPIHKMIDEANLANMELEQVIHRYKELIVRYDELIGFRKDDTVTQRLNLVEERIQELEKTLSLFEAMTREMDKKVEAFFIGIDAFNVNIAESFKA